MNNTWGVVIALAAVLLIVAAISVVGAVITHHLKRIDSGQAAATGAAISAAARAGEAATAAAKAVEEVASAAVVVASELKRGGEVQSAATEKIHQLVNSSHTEMKEYNEKLIAQLVRLNVVPEPPDKSKA